VHGRKGGDFLHHRSQKRKRGASSLNFCWKSGRCGVPLSQIKKKKVGERPSTNFVLLVVWEKKEKGRVFNIYSHEVEDRKKRPLRTA